MARGIEVFGRGATIVEVPAEAPQRRRGALLGVVALAVAVATAVLTGLAVSAASAGDESGAQVLAVAAIGASILSILGGLFAVLTRRGRVPGALGAVLAVGANPWIQLRVLEYFSTFVG